MVAECYLGDEQGAERRT